MGPHQELIRCGIDCKEKEAAGSEIFQEFSKICTYYATSKLCDRYCSATDQHLQLKITLSRLQGRTPNWQDREIWFSLSNNTLKYKAPPRDVLVFPFLSLV